MTRTCRTAWTKRYFGEVIEDDVIGLLSFDHKISIMRCVVGRKGKKEVVGVKISRLVGDMYVDDKEVYETLQDAARAVDQLDPSELLLLLDCFGTDMSFDEFLERSRQGWEAP